VSQVGYGPGFQNGSVSAMVHQDLAITLTYNYNLVTIHWISKTRVKKQG